MTPELIEKLAVEIVEEIILDISERRGIGDEWAERGAA